MKTPLIRNVVMVSALVAAAGCQPAPTPAETAAAPATHRGGAPQPAAGPETPTTAADVGKPSGATATAATTSGPGTTPPTTAATAAEPAATASADTRGASSPVARAAGVPPLVVVHKSPTCGCCHLWVEHMRKAGFAVDVRDTDDLNTVKERIGVPLGKGSCHTAEVGGYFVEGHVPAGDVRRLLAARPDAKGLVLPGMPAGSPGMEMPDGRVDPYTVELVGRDGSTSPFASHPR